MDSLWTHGLHKPWTSPCHNTRVVSLSFLQGIFPTQGLNSGLQHCRWILYKLSDKGGPLIEGNYSKNVWHFNTLRGRWPFKSCSTDIYWKDQYLMVFLLIFRDYHNLAERRNPPAYIFEYKLLLVMQLDRCGTSSICRRRKHSGQLSGREWEEDMESKKSPYLVGDWYKPSQVS